MKTNNTFFKQITKLGLLLMMALSMSACSKTSSWKEEVLLHDGSKMIVERSQRYGGAHEFLTQSSSVTEHTATFTLPNSNEKIGNGSHYNLRRSRLESRRQGGQFAACRARFDGSELYSLQTFRHL